VRLSANYLCPERRSDDGRTILEGHARTLEAALPRVQRAPAREPATRQVIRATPQRLGLATHKWANCALSDSRYYDTLVPPIRQGGCG
jgi:hypothetical protein